MENRHCQKLSDSTKECALPLTERKSRAEIIRKLPNCKSEAVVNEINKIEKELGPCLFKKLFKSITADGSREFMDIDGIELSQFTEKNRTVLYFAHPYCACERGTNENHNRMLRRFFPKGTDFTHINQNVFFDVQNWMNHYPRKKLNGLCPLRQLRFYMGSKFIFPG